MAMSRRDRSIGIVVGLLAGDALGNAGQSLRAAEVADRFGAVTEMHAAGGLAAGQWSRAGAQAFRTLESYLACRGLDEEDVALRLVAATDDPRYTVDGDSARVFDEIAEDPDEWHNAARKIWSESGGTFASNLPLARVVVAAIRNPGNLDRMIDETIRLCAITHVDPRCIESCLALNFMLVECIHDRFAADLPARAGAFVKGLQHDPAFRERVLDPAKNDLSMGTAAGLAIPYSDYPEAVVDALESLGNLKDAQLRTTIMAVDTLAVAAWCFANAKSYESGVAKAVSLGGEARAQGAITGALLGARFGFSAVPRDWAKMLPERPKAVSMAELLAGEK